MKTELLRIYTEERKEVCIRRLKAAEGQLRGVQEMIEAQRPCLEVLTQLAAVQTGQPNRLAQLSGKLRDPGHSSFRPKGLRRADGRHLQVLAVAGRGKARRPAGAFDTAAPLA